MHCSKKVLWYFKLPPCHPLPPRTMAAMKTAACTPDEGTCARGSKMNLFLKELWLCVLTCLVPPKRTGARACLCFI